MVTVVHIMCVSGPSISKTRVPAHQVILHFDLDCFYAQVEMIRNPALREVPLGKLVCYKSCKRKKCKKTFVPKLPNDSHIIRYTAEVHHSHL